eukprot:gene6442-3069_t
MASSPHSQSDAPGEDGSVRTSSGPKRANLGTFQRKMATAKRTARQHARMMVEDRRRELGMKTVRAVQTDFKILSFAKDMLPTPEAMEEPALTPGAKPKPMTVALAAELFKTNQLHVKVQYARELVATNVEGVSNPYCKISVGDQPLRTNHVMGSCNPDWNETFTFSGQTVMEADYVVVFENWSKDAMMRPDDFCGQAELDLRAVCLGTMADRLSCELTLYVLKTSGKKDSKVDYGRLFITCWMSPEDRGRHVLSPGGNATTTKELLGKLLKTKTLPAIFHSACGTLYEEPCIVFIRELRRAPTGIGSASLGCQPVNGLHMNAKGMQGMNKSLGRSYNRRGSMSKENKSFFGRFGVKDKDPVFSRFGNPAGLSAMSGMGENEVQFKDYDPDIDIYAARRMRRSWRLTKPKTKIPTPTTLTAELHRLPKKKKAAKYWIYCEVKNAKQEHTSKLRRVDPVTRKCKFEQSFVFPEVRPLHRRAPVQILFYFTNNKTRAGTLICKKSICMLKLLLIHQKADMEAELQRAGTLICKKSICMLKLLLIHQKADMEAELQRAGTLICKKSICMLKLLLIHQKADMEAELQWDHPSLPKKHKRFIDNPTVAPKFSLPLIDQEMDNVTVSMHVGAADMDYRPQMYNVPLVPPEIQEEMTQEMDNVTVSMHVGAADMDYRPQMYDVPLVPPEIQEEMTQEMDNVTVSMHVGAADMDYRPQMYNVPLVPPKIKEEMTQEMDNVTVSMHVGAADMDNRPQMYNVPLVPPEIQEEMTQMLGLELDEVYQNAQKQQQSASEADNVTKYTSGDVKSPSFTEVMEHVQQAMARTDPKGYAESLMQGSKLLYGQSLAQTEEKEERGGKAAASATVKEAQTQKVTFAGDEDAEDGLEVKRVGDDFVEHTVIGTSGWKMPSLMQTIVAWLLAPLIEMVMGRVQECKQRMKIRRCGTEVFLEEDLDITTAPVMERPSAKLSRCRAGRWSPNILADLNIVLPEDANAASLDVVGETSTFDLAPFPSPAFPGPFANGPAQHQAGHQTSNATYASPSSSFASRANSAPVKGLAGVLDTKHMSHLKDTLGATYSEPIELGSYASSSRPATLSPHASRGITHVVEKVKKDDVPAVLPVGSINIYYDKLYMSLPNVHYFVVFKIGPQWAKTAARVSGDKSSPNWEIRLPVYEPSVNYMANIYYSRSANPSPSDIKLFSSAKFPLSAITPNEVIVRDVKIAQAGFTGVEAKHYVHLRIQFTLVYPDWGELALTYKRPLRPAQWYTLNMDEHDAYIEKQYRKIIERWLNGTNPPLPPICVKHMLKSNREKFDLDLLLANVKRVWRSISGLLALLDGLQYIMSWKNPYLSVFAITVFGAFCLGPSVAVALLLCWLVLVAHGNRQLANAMPGSHDVNAEIDSDDDSDIEAPARNRLPAAALKRQYDGNQAKDKAYQQPAALKRQYDGLIRVALFVQNLLDDIATGFERFAALMRWQDPVATMIFMGTCSVISIAFYLLGMSVLLALVGAFVLRPPKFRDPEPTPPQAFFASASTWTKGIVAPCPVQPDG